MNFSTIAKQLLSGGSGAGAISMGADAINLPGTIVGTLGSVANTRRYMESFARYQNYVTSNYGAAQMAADRYMSLKERVPMSFEYYLTPEQKAEVVLYINPEKLTMTTQKVIGKAFTRGAIYYNHYGDDHWTLALHGTVGWSQMRGIEALEEVYHYSGTLLKWQNVRADTVHTNKMTKYGTVSEKLADLLNSDSPIQRYFGKVMGTVTDALGMSGSGSVTSKLFGQRASEAANGNLFTALANSVLGAADGLGMAMGVSQLTNSGLGRLATVAVSNPEAFSAVGKVLGDCLGGGIASQVGSALKGDLLSAVLGQKGGALDNILDQLNFGATNAVSSILSLLNGDLAGAAQTSTVIPTTASAGNFYVLGTMTATELNSIVGTVASVTQSNTIDKSAAEANWADIQDVLTDPYRPRQVFIYYDDRVFIGHFTSFNWDRQAAHPLIYYDLKFTVTRQVILTKNAKQTTSSSTPSLTGLLAGVAGGLLEGVFKKSGKSSAGAGGSGTESGDVPVRGGGAVKTR